MREIEYNLSNRPDPQEIRGFLHYEAGWIAQSSGRSSPIYVR